MKRIQNQMLKNAKNKNKIQTKTTCAKQQQPYQLHDKQVFGFISYKSASASYNMRDYDGDIAM